MLEGMSTYSCTIVPALWKRSVANVSNSGAYASCKVPSTEAPGTDYFVKVISRLNSNIFGNSGVFSITAQ